LSSTPLATSESKVPLGALPTHAGIFNALQARLGLSVRRSQAELAEIVRETVQAGADSVCCVEAPTGTGKTLGYLAGALDAQTHSGDPRPIVVATATVGLQSQIMTQDIPRLAAVGAVDPQKVVLAKGRNRYFCPHTAEMLKDKGDVNQQQDLFDSGKDVLKGGVPIALDMLHAWKEGKWDGDKDSWKSEIPECWDDYCGANAQTCVNRACVHREKCPYMKSRTKMSKAQVIVANHDIVLADLAARVQDGSSTVLPVKSYSLIVDEAHNFPDKAVDTQRAKADLFHTDWLRDLAPYGESTSNIDALCTALARIDGVPRDVFGRFAAQVLGKVEGLHAELLDSLKFDKSGVCSWGLQAPNASLALKAFDLETDLAAIVKALKRSSLFFLEQAQESSGGTKGRCLRYLTETNRFLKQANSLHAGLHAFRSEDRLVRWAKHTSNGGVVLNAQPLEGEQVLKDLLWKHEIPVAMVSATLQVAGSFERFAKKAGLPGHAVRRRLPPVFDYGRGLLHMPQMAYEPNQEAHEAEVVDKIERLFAKEVAAGTLVLFTSRESLQRVANSLKGPIRDCLLLQGSAPLPELVKAHKQRVDSGQRSVLMGLDSMSEGLDLPGDYCNHVVITRLPFAVPSDPVEAARRDAMGEDWFEKSYLADMLTALIQSCGRLVRRETDHGVITILDKRMWTKRYAARVRNALPDFTRSNRISRYQAMAQEYGFEIQAFKKPETTTSAAPIEPQTPVESEEAIEALAAEFELSVELVRLLRCGPQECSRSSASAQTMVAHRQAGQDIILRDNTLDCELPAVASSPLLPRSAHAVADWDEWLLPNEEQASLVSEVRCYSAHAPP